jgi:predicted dehydrogenase
VHQTEQFLFFTGARDATVTHAAAGNVAHPATPQLQDFGEASLRGDNGATGYFRVDWLTPDGLRTWGDGRTVILGTEGYLELRKYIDLGRAGDGDLLILVDGRRERRFDLRAPMAFPFFRQLIDDCRHRTETAMTQAHAFKAAELALLAQRDARRITAPRELSERSSRRRG